MAGATTSRSRRERRSRSAPPRRRGRCPRRRRSRCSRPSSSASRASSTSSDTGRTGSNQTPQRMVLSYHRRLIIRANGTGAAREHGVARRAPRRPASCESSTAGGTCGPSTTAAVTTSTAPGTSPVRCTCAGTRSSPTLIGRRRCSRRPIGSRRRWRRRDRRRALRRHVRRPSRPGRGAGVVGAAGVRPRRGGRARRWDHGVASGGSSDRDRTSGPLRRASFTPRFRRERYADKARRARRGRGRRPGAARRCPHGHGLRGRQRPHPGFAPAHRTRIPGRRRALDGARPRRVPASTPPVWPRATIGR